MCAHYKYRNGSLAGLVNISGGWLSLTQEDRAVADHLYESLHSPKSTTSGDAVPVFPGDSAEILVVREGKREIVLSSYGLIPHFIPKGRTKPSELYNCRDDSLNGLEVKPSFREAFAKRRCIASISHFEENLGGNRWLEIHPKGQSQDFFVAALYNLPHQFCKTTSHALVTTVPNATILPLHDRMPVILDQAGIDLWLEPTTPVSVLLSLLIPCPNEWIGEIRERQDPSRRNRRQGGFDF